MGRRSKIEMEGLAQKCYHFYFDEKLTVEQATARLIEEDNFTGSRESVRNYIKKAKELGERFREYEEQAKLMAESLRDRTDTNVSDMLIRQLQGLLMQRSMDLDLNDMEDPMDIINGTVKLVEANLKSTKLRMDFNKGVEKARDAILTALKENLRKDHPELLEQLSRIVCDIKIEGDK